MKTVKLLLSFALTTTLLTSCYVETNIIDDEPTISINQLLGSYELWYVDINSTSGFGETPFLQKAFTISFRNGVMYANNNLVGIGSSGNGYGIAVADYDAYNMILDVTHDADGFETFDVFQIDNNTFGIYDTFEVEEGRQAHLTGEVAKALLANAGDLLENFDPSTDIQAVDVLAFNHQSGLQNKGLLVIMKSKEAKTTDVENFLNVGKQLVGDEPKTLSWYAIKIDATTYAIFDTFADDSGRDTHLTGKVAAALMENAPVLLDGFEASAIQKIDIIASK